MRCLHYSGDEGVHTHYCNVAVSSGLDMIAATLTLFFEFIYPVICKGMLLCVEIRAQLAGI